jgi:hypothetical protein
MDEYLPSKSQTKKDKFFEFILGLVLFCFLNIILGIIIIFGFGLANRFPLYFPVCLGFGLLLNVAVIGHLYKIKKTYVALGMLSGFVLPLLIAGSCIGVFSFIK